ncbi:hypothetical protein CAEBREN_18588 [Caenorhabditis brenneri]|uniref:Uncharacterized protein n=1 Tax=Caenorhabditis brenneri TaxID=135651 RepID=G0M9D0_CAEBE|nr:hypothetical protein CAEBREN_18588 [Caenorhabditis brenneri]
MYTSCPPDIWLGSPDSLILFSHIKTAVITPMHLLCAYCILTKTPATMKSVKWTLLNFHFWNVFMDFMLNFLSVPIPLFPTASGVLVGVLSTFGVPSTVQLWLLMEVVSVVCFSTTMIFENRFHLLNDENVKWNFARPYWILGNIIFCFAYMIPTCLQLPDQKLAKERTLNSLPCVPYFLVPLDIVTTSLDQTIIIISAITFVTLMFGQLLTFAFIIYRQLSSNFGANVLSENTRKLQKNLLKALIWQTGVPMVYLVLPVTYATFSFSTGYFSMVWNNIVANLASLHGLVSTLSIILIHKPYRDTFGFWCKKESTVSNVRSFQTATD